jgi:hypothetical protein
LRVCGEGISGCGRGDGVGARRHCECSRVVNGDVEVEIVRTEVRGSGCGFFQKSK